MSPCAYQRGVPLLPAEQHLQPYLDEFTFRWNNRSKPGIEDEERARVAAYGMNDKRLTYRWTEAG